MKWPIGNQKTPKDQTRDPNTLRAQYLENSWRCYLATIVFYEIAVLLYWVLVLVLDLNLSTIFGYWYLYLYLHAKYWYLYCYLHHWYWYWYWYL